jgi:AraC-like DNA-binding protein
MAVTRAQPEPAVWTRVSPVQGHPLDLLHARVSDPYAPHVHEEFALGACTAGTELIHFRGDSYYAGPGSVVILEPGEPHTGGPAGPPGFVYRVMYPAAGLLADGLAIAPRFRQPVVIDPGLARELRRVHAALARSVQHLTASGAPGPGRGAPGPAADPLELESRLVGLLGVLVDRHASAGPAGGTERKAYRVARDVMSQLAEQLTSPPGLTEMAAAAGMSRYQLLRSFRAEVGMPPYAWLAQHRVTRARALLDLGHRPAEAAALAGFADQAHLTRWFRRVVGVTPGIYCNGVQDSTGLQRR